MPQPSIHDEFSYLLAADTFTSGRLTNPTHPMWVHFESMHIIHQPTYTSKYPPGQGLALAVGQVLSGRPIVGVWLSMGLACAAVTWMLQAWLPPWWALLGGLLMVVRMGIFGYWSQTYWGGAVAAIGGALVWGAVRRVVSRPRVREALLLGLGLAILANSRPFEGLLVSLPAAGVLLVWTVRRTGPDVRVALRSVWVPVLIVLLLTAGMMGGYNLRVTGDPLRLPYLVHEEAYYTAPLFLWQRPRPEPPYRHQVLRDFHREQAQAYMHQRSLAGFVAVKATRFRELWQFYLGPALTLPLIFLPWVLKDRWMRLVLLTSGAVAVGLLAEVANFLHYSAPMTGLLFALVLQSMRHLRVWRWRGRPIGRFVIWGIVVICVVLAPQNRGKLKGWNLLRAGILARLEESGDRHLVIVRYWTSHHPQSEWVYNKAEIDGAKVVWAREMDAAQNRKLLEYFKDRRVWLLEAAARPPRLTPYPLGSSPDLAAQPRRAALITGPLSIWFHLHQCNRAKGGRGYLEASFKI
jgi:hypothetical protein